MQATIHAALLLVIPLAVLVAILTLKRRAPSSRQFLLAIALAALGTLAAPMFNHHLCREGEPRNQWLIVGPCLFLALLLIDSRAWRRVISASVFVAMMGLSCHFTELVHTPGWTGNPSWDGGQQAVFRSLQKSAAIVVSDMEDPKVTLPEGWLRESSIWPSVEKQFGDVRPHRREVHGVWHSLLTGLYEYSRIPQDFWYPGGPLEDGIPHIQLKDRAAER